MLSELHRYHRKNAFAVSNHTAHLPFSGVPCSSSQPELNQVHIRMTMETANV